MNDICKALKKLEQEALEKYGEFSDEHITALLKLLEATPLKSSN